MRNSPFGGDLRALYPSDVDRWISSWNSGGLLNERIYEYIFLFVVVFIPVVVVYYLWIKMVFSRNFRLAVASGENGVHPIQVFFVLIIATLIVNDIFLSCLFSGPIWALVYENYGAEFAVSIEQSLRMFGAINYIFG